MGERYSSVKALEAYLSGQEGDHITPVPHEVVIDLLREAVTALDTLLAMGPRSLECAALGERDVMLQAIETLTEEKRKIKGLLEYALQLESDENR